MSAYPDGLSARDRFVTRLRPPRAIHDPWRAHGVVVEDEPVGRGAVSRLATVFLTGRECPWRCVMCDLWRFTTVSDTPPGAVAAQVTAAVSSVADLRPAVTGIKLYNAGSFFDPRAVPPGDHDQVARATRGYERVIVESHPSLVGRSTGSFLATVRRHATGLSPGPALEVAMGLETVHPGALTRLNKRMSVDDFERAATRLRNMGVALRVFLLVCPPFVPEDEQDLWLTRSIDAAFAAGAGVVSLIPTRGGNGAIEALSASADFRAPRLHDLERSLALALNRPRPGHALVLADLWDLDRFSACAHCIEDRRTRLAQMNLQQRVFPPPTCAHCDTIGRP